MIKFSLLGLTILLVVSCAPTSIAPPPVDNPATSPVRAEPHPGNTAAPVSEGRLPDDGSRHPLSVQSTQVAGAKLTYLSFDARNHTLSVVDQSSVGSQYRSAAEVTQRQKALATINGGFFTPEGKPLGLLYHNGKKVGHLNRSSSLGSGILYVDQKFAKPVITRRESFENWLKDEAFEPKEVLQSGPFLVEGGRAISGLKNEEPRIRSLLLWDGENHFAIAQCSAITLRNLAHALASQPLSGFQIEVALNLDGGRSADFNVSSKVSGGPLNLRRWLNKPVRNYLILTPQ